jgi:hypothetical protein
VYIGQEKERIGTFRNRTMELIKHEEKQNESNKHILMDLWDITKWTNKCIAEISENKERIGMREHWEKWVKSSKIG